MSDLSVQKVSCLLDAATPRETDGKAADSEQSLRWKVEQVHLSSAPERWLMRKCFQSDNLNENTYQRGNGFPRDTRGSVSVASAGFLFPLGESDLSLDLVQAGLMVFARFW